MLGPTPLENILDAFSCERKGDAVSEEAQRCKSPEGYIWIKTGAVYTAPTLTNDTAWVCLVKRLKTLPNVSSRVVVVTGRHGDAVNWELADGTPLFTYDESHTVDDRKKEEENRLGMSPARVQVVSVITMGAPHREKLRSATHAWLTTGHTVIYSWCYSFYSFNYMMCPDYFEEYLAASVQYSRAKEVYETHKNDTTRLWSEVKRDRESSKKKMNDLERIVNDIGQRVDAKRKRARAAKLEETLAATAESDWCWMLGTLHHRTLGRPRAPNRRPLTREKLKI